MKKALIALVTAACFAAAAVMPNPADASSSGRRLLQGILLGAGAAILFGAAARAHLDPRYHPWAPAQGYYYVQGPVYSSAPPIGCPNGFWAYKVNQFGQPYGQPRWFCPPPGYYAAHYQYGY